jgi:hypothetical protein
MFNDLDFLSRRQDTALDRPREANGPMLGASLSLARLDERLKYSPAPVRAGWVSRAIIHEATASARLDGVYVPANDLTLILSDTPDRTPDQDLGRTMDLHRMLAALNRRNPKHLFSPQRLIALTRLRLRGRVGQPSLPDWLQQRLGDPEAMRTAIHDALRPETVALWPKLPPLEAAAEIIAHWRGSGAADAIGAAPGRALAMAWVYRAGLTSGYYLLPAVGFLAHAGDFRPDLDARWPELFMAGCGRAADWGLKLHAYLSAAHRRLHEEAPRQRSTSSMTALIDLLVSTPALSSRRAADALGLTPHGVRRMLAALENQNLVHELTRRNAFRLYAPASLAGFSGAI